MAREFFCAYHSYLEQLEAYTDEEVGRLFRACLRYSMDGTTPEFTGNERFLWASLRQQIDRDKASYDTFCEKQKANGEKGGRPKKPTGYSDNPNNPTVFSETQKTLREGEGEGEGKGECEGEGNITPLPLKEKRKRFVPPTVFQVKEYCDERNNGINPEAFIAYYEARGWKIGSNKMHDWKAAVRYWETRREGKAVNMNEGRLDWIDKVDLDI